MPELCCDMLRSVSAAGRAIRHCARERKNLGERLRKVRLGFPNGKNTGGLVSVVTSDAAFLEIEGTAVIEKTAAGIPLCIIGFAASLVFDYRIFLLTVFFVYFGMVHVQKIIGIAGIH